MKCHEMLWKAMFCIFVSGMIGSIGAAADAAKASPGFGATFAKLASEKAGYTAGDEVLCITNAGYASWQGKDTLAEIQPLEDKFGCSLGKGNLFSVHSRMDARPWFILTKKSKDTSLRSVCGTIDEKGVLTVSDPVEVALTKDLDNGKIKSVCGELAGSAVGFSNTWNAKAPWHLVQGALFHNHFCPGVTSGYIIAKWILKNIPLGEGESYMIIGLPQWCKEDSLITALDVTPGKRGYYAMKWTDDQKAAMPENTTKDFAGLFVKVSNKESKFVSATVYALGFVFHKEEFLKQLGEDKHPDFFNLHLLLWSLKRMDDPSYFVSVLKEKTITDEKEFEQLTAPGGDPLEIMGLYK